MKSKLTPGEYRPVFVYGTLLPGQPNFGLWMDAIVSARQAYFQHGRLYDMGHYPMLVESDFGQVRGMLVDLDQTTYDATLARLDRLEGFDPGRPEASIYRRVVRRAQDEDGQTKACWLYIGRPRYVSGLLPIKGGDWVAHSAEKLSRSRAWWSEIESVFGLHPPGESEG